jgi:hypothetical protein
MKTNFLIKDCAISAIATGEKAYSLIELRDLLFRIDKSCIFHHFWADLLRPKFIHPEYHNDFANWAHYKLHDNFLAEKLGIIDPTDFPDLEELRSHLIEVIESRIEEHEFFFWTKHHTPFYFMKSVIVVFDSKISLKDPVELPNVISSLTPSSIFYHFIDARRRTKYGTDDFTIWLQNFGETYQKLITNIHAIDPYFLTLTSLRSKILEVVTEYFISPK